MSLKTLPTTAEMRMIESTPGIMPAIIAADCSPTR